MHPVFTRLPSGVLIKGAAVSYRPTDTTSFTAFGGTWGGGSQTYDQTWFTDAIDVIVAAGGNTVRIFGDLELQIAGTLQASDYLSRVDAVISYAASKGVYVYFTGASSYQLLGVADGSGVITSTARQLFRDIYNTVRAHSNVIAFDAIQEAYAWVTSPVGDSVDDGHIHQPNITGEQLATVMQTVYSDLKGESTALPITFSAIQIVYTNSSMWLPISQRTAVNDSLDYLDFHCYYSPNAIDLWPVRKETQGRPIIIGEFGSPTETHPTLGNGCDYAVMQRIVEQLNIDGCIEWSVFDHSTDQTTAWGMADNDGTLRSGRGTVFHEFPVVPVGAAGNWTFNGSRVAA